MKNRNGGTSAAANSPGEAHRIASATAWREAARAGREARAERLALPSGTVIRAAKPQPLEWVLAGRIPQRLLAATLASGPEHAGAEPGQEISREEVIELARFAVELVKASVVEPALGEGDGEIAIEDVPIEDRAFIFEWACRALGAGDGERNRDANEEGAIPANGIERFRGKR